jgi:hypothetical protein
MVHAGRLSSLLIHFSRSSLSQADSAGTQVLRKSRNSTHLVSQGTLPGQVLRGAVMTFGDHLEMCFLLPMRLFFGLPNPAWPFIQHPSQGATTAPLSRTALGLSTEVQLLTHYVFEGLARGLVQPPPRPMPQCNLRCAIHR